jgi:hypothetical protein
MLGPVGPGAAQPLNTDIASTGTVLKLIALPMHVNGILRISFRLKKSGNKMGRLKRRALLELNLLLHFQKGTCDRIAKISGRSYPLSLQRDNIGQAERVTKPSSIHMGEWAVRMIFPRGYYGLRLITIL